MTRKIRISKGMLFTWLMLGTFICLFLPQTLTGKLHLAFLGLYKFTPSLGRGIPLAAVEDSQVSGGAATGYQLLELRYNQLKNHCDNLWAELAIEHGKNQRLAGLRTRFPALSSASFIYADIIQFKNAQIAINRGSADGIKKGQFVLGDNCIIGSVAETTAKTAVIRLITDSASSLPVQIAGSNFGGMMKGGGKDKAHIKNVPRKYKIQKDAIVYVCKMPGKLDAPLIAAKVDSVKPDDDHPLLWDIVVKPTSNIETLTSVDVIVMNP